MWRWGKTCGLWPHVGVLKVLKSFNRIETFCTSGQCQLSIICLGNFTNPPGKGEWHPTGVSEPHTPHPWKTHTATKRHQWLLQTYRICKLPAPSSPAQWVLRIKFKCYKSNSNARAETAFYKATCETVSTRQFFTNSFFYQ